MYVINPSFLYFIVHRYKMFQNKSKYLKIAEILSSVQDHVEKTCSAISDVTRTGLI